MKLSEKVFIFVPLSNSAKRCGRPAASILTFPNITIFHLLNVVEQAKRIPVYHTIAQRLTLDGTNILPTLTSNDYSTTDIGACNRYTFTHKVFGSGKIVITNKWLCYKLLTTTETTTANDTTAENELSLYFHNGGKGVASLPHSFSFTHSGWRHKNLAS